ncbi:MAG: hypothetical protein IKS39_01695 [Clostridia bacterium]|nr:hypothetical protein [Clostridia bacterium]
MIQLTSFIMILIMFLFPTVNVSKINVDKTNWNTDFDYVYVHGLSGWGSYDFQNNLLPYWGMFGGDMIKNLNSLGFKCHSASVDPDGSAWDRACELYAQLTGTKTDYGKAHSEKYGHNRFGKDFSRNPLIKSWSSEDKINLLGHSFGGVTVRLLAELMANGSEEELAVTETGDISQLFTGGKADWIYSITTLAAPTNGTTAYGFSDPEKQDNHDTAAYDMFIDNALAINERISTDENTYYFAIPCSATVQNEDGSWRFDENINVEFPVRSTGDRIMNLTGTTPKGYVVDESWLENDGMVNTISAGAPFNAPSTNLDIESIEPGIWNVAPIYRGDHMAFCGDLFRPNNIRPFFADWMDMINSI